MPDTFPPAEAGQALLLKANLTSHLFDREFGFARLTSFGSFVSYILTPIPSLLRKEGRSHDKDSDLMIELLPFRVFFVSLPKTIF